MITTNLVVYEYTMKFCEIFDILVFSNYLWWFFFQVQMKPSTEKEKKSATQDTAF